MEGTRKKISMLTKRNRAIGLNMSRMLEFSKRFRSTNSALEVMDGNSAAASMAYALSEQVRSYMLIARLIIS
jgi:hypothetical protein